MNSEKPAWADSLKNLLTGLAEQAPQPLLPLLAMFGGATVTSTDLAEYVNRADQNDPAFTQIRLAFGKWDAADLVLPDPEGNPTAPLSLARRLAIYQALGIDQDAQEAINLRVPPFERPTIVISQAFEPWYDEARKKRSGAYWSDYATYLREKKKWSADAIAGLDQSTTQIVERLADPTRREVKQTKGLVVGYVQSGKTANFTGVVAKAIDSGYRLVIVLTGTIEILRAQTQRRMDMELMGVENILAGQDPADPLVAKELDYQQDQDWHADKFVRHGAALEQDGVPHIDRVTTHRSDYKRLPQGLTKLKFHKYEKAKPFNAEENLFRSDAYVAVIKKNVAALRKLIQDLKPIRDGLAELPVLIIDDESDQATPDTTNPDRWKPTAEGRRRTAINGKITELMGLCPRAQYIGYTATPFANVFIDPNDDTDLFPSDFVLSLERTPGYMGVQQFHDVDKDWDSIERTVATSNELAHVRALSADPAVDPVGRNAELRDAIDAWVIAGAIKKYRTEKSGTEFRHHTMLVHESVKKNDHRETADAVRGVWRSARLTTGEGLARLRLLFESDFLPVMEARADGQPVPVSFDELKSFIASAVAQMTVDGDPVLVINSDAEIQAQQKKLDFEADDVWRILVGGTQLSRGFTVEGLTTSYFRRKAGQADTLMQAGRWFGYRNGYQDLVRLFIRRDAKVDLYEAFEALLLDEEDFRSELRQYEGFDEDGIPLVEPRQVPPLVSQHLPWLKPTARNKRWNAVIESQATAGTLLDKLALPLPDQPGYTENLTSVGVPLVAAATTPTTIPYGVRGRVEARVGVVGADEFLEIFGKMAWNPDFADAQVPFLRFLTEATKSGRITDWAVAWPQPPKAEHIEIPGLGETPIAIRKRRPGRSDFPGSASYHRKAFEPILRGEGIPGLPGSPGRGVVMLSLAHESTDTTTSLSVRNVVPLLSVGAPVSATPKRRDLIQWTVRVESEPEEIAVDMQA